MFCTEISGFSAYSSHSTVHQREFGSAPFSRPQSPCINRYIRYCIWNTKKKEILKWILWKWIDFIKYLPNTRKYISYIYINNEKYFVVWFSCWINLAKSVFAWIKKKKKTYISKIKITQMWKSPKFLLCYAC